MGWGGVSIIWPLEGQSDADAIGAHYGVRIVLSSHGEHTVEPNGTYGPIPRPGQDSDDLLTQALRGLRQIAPHLTEAEPTRHDHHGHLLSMCLHDEIGQQIDLYPGTATLRPGKDRTHDQFARTWRYVTCLASLRRAVAWEGDDDILIDVSLPLEKARETYRWS